ncbi:MAG: 3-deoxy-manno-octulosonate cytidylyltransferase [Candidatus Protochlamydia sp.]|nr:3-deoxy-manno-octulosonate cytidylyltransferase [Candidatus Protochlamydia sp.]
MVDDVIGIIPARYDSTRFPGKPLVPILGKTLLQRTYENASLASLKEIIVATDDRRIYDHVVSFGGLAAMTGPGCRNGTDRLAEVLRMHPEWLKASAIVNIQGDEPLIEPWAIDLAVKALLDDPAAMMSTLAAPLLSEEEVLNPSNVKCVIDIHGNALYFSRSLIPSNKKNQFRTNTTYLGHIGLYVYRPEFVLEYQKLKPTPLQLEEDLEQLKVLENGYRIKVMVIDHASLGVDTPEDIKKIEQRLIR